MKRVIAGAAATAGAWLLLVAQAEAATGEQIGRNVKHMLLGIAGSMYIGIVAIVTVKFLLGRHYVELGVFLLAALVIGGVVLMPDVTAGTVKDIWRSVTAG